jgi:hypothetical protein
LITVRHTAGAVEIISERGIIMSKLSEDAMEQVKGGVIFNAVNIIGADPNRPWEVLDDKNGNKIAAYATREEALWVAGACGENAVELNWDQVLQLRGQK